MSSDDVPAASKGLFEGLKWSVILRGAIIDNLLTIVALVPLMLYFAGPDAFSQDGDAMNEAVERALTAPEFAFWTFVIGMAVTVYAAFWAARTAGSLELIHGGWTAVASIALAAVFSLLSGTSGSTEPLSWRTAVSLLMIPAGMLGGWIATKVPKPPRARKAT